MSLSQAAFRTTQNSFIFRKAAGSSFIQLYKPIAFKQAAANSSAYGSEELVDYHKKMAATGDPKADDPEAEPRNFLSHGQNKTDYFNLANGGMHNPTDIGLWKGTLFRVQYVKEGTREAGVVAASVTGAWWVSHETFIHMCKKARSSEELLQTLRGELALGFELKLETTRIARAVIRGPTAAYAGRAKPTSGNYERSAFPIFWGNPTLAQIYIPGLRDKNDKPDPTVADAVFDIDATNTYDAVGALNKFGSTNASPTDADGQDTGE